MSRSAKRRSVGIIGGGIAGASVTAGLRHRGIDATIGCGAGAGHSGIWQSAGIADTAIDS